ncbi:MAG: F0F1 ATP synthase subunit A [Candidatus Coatesbacteria bacterium]|nr:F0F1 ATP synthase subunit A [Candidatus Coatesbacteria bacterium]
METIGQVARIQLWGEASSTFGAVNYVTLIMTWLVMALVIAGAAVIVRRLKPVPGRVQFLIESLARFFDNLVKDALNREDRAFLPLIGSLFVYLLASNWIGVIPGLEEPTRDINTPLSLGIMGFFIWHISGMRAKGVFGYIKEFFQPVFFMFPLNAVGEIAKVISISFRLFGNIMGGAIIIIVVSHLLHFLVIPIILNGFFGLFVGSVQAFVFTMLYLTYSSVAMRTE